MCAHGSKSYHRWRVVFLITETFALIGMIYATAWVLAYQFYSHHHIPLAATRWSARTVRFCEYWMRPMAGVFLLAVGFLALGTPFFLRSALRRHALTGWLIGLCALIYVGWIAFK